MNSKPVTILFLALGLADEAGDDGSEELGEEGESVLDALDD